MDLQMVGEDRVALMGNGWMLEGNGGGLLAVYPGRTGYREQNKAIACVKKDFIKNNSCYY